MADIKWPKNYYPFYKAVAKHKDIITQGTVLAIDPASGGSSYPGYALFVNGEMVSSGDVPVNAKLPVNLRMQCLYDSINGLARPDLLVVEEIRGHMAHTYLKFSVGMIMAAVRCPICIEIPISVWKAYAGRNHIKSDQADAEKMGLTIIELAKR
jgi:hypothetical protein